MKKRFFSVILAAFLIIPVVAANIRVTSINNEINTEQFSYKGSYPIIRGIVDQKEESKLNVSFKEMEQKAKRTTELAARQLGSDAITRHIKVEGVFNYEVKRECSGIMSILFTDYLFSGGAHGRTIKTGRNFNQISGKEYSLKSLFKPDMDYVTTISNEIKKQIKERKIVDQQLVKFEKISKIDDFYLTNDSLVIFFSEYEYFPYSFGIQEFGVPLKTLEGILIPEVKQCT
jgi:hypothetical protein